MLHKAGLVPKASDMIVTLSRLYTETLGGWALWLFYAGAVITLYGTIFASTAAHARVTADLVRMAGGFARADGAARGRWRDINTVILATLPAIFFWTIGSPVRMVVAGGLAQALMLPLIGLAAVYLRHRARARGSAARAAHDRGPVAVRDRDGVGGALLRRLAAARLTRAPARGRRYGWLVAGVQVAP